MTTNRLLLTAALALAGCGDDAPTCADAVRAYYATGCELEGEIAGPFEESEALTHCEVASASTATGCAEASEDLRECMGAASADACDCKTEASAVLDCQGD